MAELGLNLKPMIMQNTVKIVKHPLGELKQGNFHQNDENIEASMRGNKKQRAGKAGEGKVGRNKTPQAVAVARRNARERNRVKQVNNGFSALRQHIPNEIAELFEQPPSKSNTSTTSASAKKLSKVETLRMAVEYIRHLESMLNSDGSSSVQNTSSSSMDSYLPATPPPETNSNVPQQTYFYAIKPRPIYSDPDDDSNSTFPSTEQTQIAIINGQQFVRIGANTFQLVLQDYKEDENTENIKPDFDVLPAGTIVQNPPPSISSNNASSVMISVDQIKHEPNTTPNSFIAITPSLLQQMKVENIQINPLNPGPFMNQQMHEYVIQEDEMLFSTDSTSNDWQDMS